MANPSPAALYEEELRKVTVGVPPRLDGPVLLVEYDPVWPEKFARDAQRIRAALNSRVVRLEHIGSTAVPGLIAKPIIDILLVVADSSDECTYIPALEAKGYTLRLREPGWHQHRLLKGPDTNVNLHVFSTGSIEIDRVVALRDRLRADPAERGLYAQAKKALASKSWKYVQNYADAKSGVIESILARAGAPAPVATKPTGTKPLAADGER